MTAPTVTAKARVWRRTVIVAAGTLLGACASSPPAPIVDLSSDAPAEPPHDAAAKAVRSDSGGTYRVLRGDTLYAIAFSRGLDFRDVANWNSIAPPYRIYAGQELRLQPPTSAGHVPAAVAVASTPRPAPAQPAPAAPTGVAASAARGPATRTDHPGMFEDVAGETPAPAPNNATSTQASPPSASAGAPATSGARAPSVEPPARSGMGEPKAQAPDAGAKSAGVAAVGAADSFATAANGLAWRWPGKGSLVGTFVAGDPTRQGIDIAGNAGDPVLAAADGEVVYSGNGLLGYGELIIVKHNSNFLSAYGHNRKRLVQEGEKVRGGQQIAEMGSSATSRDELHFEIRKNGKPVNPLDYLPAR